LSDLLAGVLIDDESDRVIGIGPPPVTGNVDASGWIGADDIPVPRRRAFPDGECTSILNLELKTAARRFLNDL
jgi:hypothetical protein